jgi:hypothetical protein
MPSDDFAISGSIVSAAANVALTFPNSLAADRTATTFRVLTDALTAGDLLEFQLTPA